MWRPSGAQIGFQSIGSSLVTGVAGPPPTGIVQISVRRGAVPPRLPNAIRLLCGDTLGWIASPSNRRTGSPPDAFTTHNSLSPSLFWGLMSIDRKSVVEGKRGDLGG